jgi:L-ascorbate metabolism protein UlaG (beta-lactamase superfamily)
MDSHRVLTGIALIVSIILTLYIFPTMNIPTIKTGEARIHYASYSGWIIETSKHVLIIDYIETPPNYSGIQSTDLPHTLENGYISPEFIEKIDTIVLTSHAHTDHYEPLIHDFQDWTEDIQYYFGWDMGETENTISFTGYRETHQEEYKIYTVNHPFAPEDEPEVAYLVEIDGLTLFHSGDLSVSDPEIRSEFKSNIDYLAEISDEIDVAFISMARGWYGNITNGGDIYTIQTLNPNVVFPQHYPNSPVNYKLFAEEAIEKEAKSNYGLAENRGDTWFYSQGTITKIENAT